MRPRRPSATGAARHSDDWLITYADTITLLLCVFVVLVAFRDTRPHIAAVAESLPAAASAPPAPAFPPPPIVVVPVREPEGPPPPLAGAEAEPDSRAWTSLAAAPAPAPAAMEDRPPASALPRIAANADHREATPDAARQQDGEMTNQHESVAPVPAAVSAAFVPGQAASAPARSPSAAETTPRPRADEPPGDRITVFQCSDAAFFESGSATLSDAGKGILRKLFGTLLAPRFAGYRITVEGHTDNQPISGPQFPSNWELSSARAASVVRFFIDQGIPADRLRAAGYADTQPLAPNRDAAGNPIPENQAKNRRVVVELEKIDREARYSGS